MLMLCGCTTTGKDTGSPDSGVAKAPLSDSTKPPTGTPSVASFSLGSAGSNQQLKTYLASLKFNFEVGEKDSAVLVDYECKSNDSCRGTMTRFLVIPESNSEWLHWDDMWTNGVQQGSVTAAYLNVDEASLPSLNLGPHDVMYQWVGAVTDQVAGAAYAVELFSVDGNGKVRRASFTQDIQICTDPGHANRNKPAAKHNPGHKDCQPKKAPGPVINHLASWKFPDDLWISCGGGCCQSSPSR
jgi:hypothetical protein